MIKSRRRRAVTICTLSLTFSVGLAGAVGSPQTRESSIVIATQTQVIPRVTQVIPRVEETLPTVRGEITEFTVPTPNSFPAGITEGADGKLWFVENTGNNLAAFDVHTHTFFEYLVPTPNSARCASSPTLKVICGSPKVTWIKSASSRPPPAHSGSSGFPHPAPVHSNLP
jgi:streptogramin lyase